jgi:hypothetical protein
MITGAGYIILQVEPQPMNIVKSRKQSPNFDSLLSSSEPRASQDASSDNIILFKFIK